MAAMSHSIATLHRCVRVGGWVGGWLGGWLGGWVGGWVQGCVKNSATMLKMVKIDLRVKNPFWVLKIKNLKKISFSEL